MGGGGSGYDEVGEWAFGVLDCGGIVDGADGFAAFW